MSGPLFPRHPMTRLEVGKAAERALAHATKVLGAIDDDAHRVRAAFVAKNRPDDLDEKTRERRRRKQFLVKGRMAQDGRTYWDIFRLQHNGRPKYHIGGFVWQAEAIAKARDLLLGRVSVSFGRARAVFRAPGAGKLITPLRKVDQPGEAEVSVRDAPGGAVVVSR